MADDDRVREQDEREVVEPKFELPPSPPPPVFDVPVPARSLVNRWHNRRVIE